MSSYDSRRDGRSIDVGSVKSGAGVDLRGYVLFCEECVRVTVAFIECGGGVLVKRQWAFFLWSWGLMGFDYKRQSLRQFWTKLQSPLCLQDTAMPLRWT